MMKMGATNKSANVVGVLPMDLAEPRSTVKKRYCSLSPLMWKTFAILAFILFWVTSIFILHAIFKTPDELTSTEIIVPTGIRETSSVSVERNDVDLFLRLENKTSIPMSVQRKRRAVSSSKKTVNSEKSNVLKDFDDDDYRKARAIVMESPVPCQPDKQNEFCKSLIDKVNSVKVKKEIKTQDEPQTETSNTMDTSNDVTTMSDKKENIVSPSGVVVVPELLRTQNPYQFYQTPQVYEERVIPQEVNPLPVHNHDNCLLARLLKEHYPTIQAYFNQQPVYEPVIPVQPFVYEIPNSDYVAYQTVPVAYAQPEIPEFISIIPQEPQEYFVQARDDSALQDGEPHPQDARIVMRYQTSEPPMIPKSARETDCPSGTLSCANGEECIAASQWCDGKVNCEDVSDELRCTCKSRVDKSRLCDGYYDCPFGEDEMGCFGCDLNGFSCDDTDLNSRVTCFTKEQRCDSIINCPNSKDEMECNILASSLNEKPLFPVSHTEGFLQRNYKGNWYSVCINPYMWAHDACRRETGLIVRPPYIQLAPIDPTMKIVYLNNGLGGIVHKSESCMNSTAVYVTCPHLLCGTRVLTTSQLLLRQNTQFEGRLYDRNKRFLTNAPQLGWPEQIKERSLEPYHEELLYKDKLRSKRVESRVVGGMPSQPAAWPWMVAIYKDGHFHCGGVIIDKRWIMSAAHCVDKFWEHHYEIQVGMLRRFSFSPQEQNLIATHVIVNKFYDKEDMKNDLSLLRVKPAIMYSRWARPICLPNPESAGPDWMWGPKTGTLCTAVGWGATVERGPDPDHMREVEVPIWEKCNHRQDRLGKEICAGYAEGGKDTCQGDSGGPLLCKNPSNPQQWYVAGIVSHGAGCARKGELGVYTRVSIFTKWINYHISSPRLPTIQPKQECPDFKCVSGIPKCLPKRRVCNKIVDCLDGEDELNCNGEKNNPSLNDNILVTESLGNLNITDEIDLLLNLEKHSDGHQDDFYTNSSKSGSTTDEIQSLSKLNKESSATSRISDEMEKEIEPVIELFTTPATTNIFQESDGDNIDLLNEEVTENLIFTGHKTKKGKITAAHVKIFNITTTPQSTEFKTDKAFEDSLKPHSREVNKDLTLDSGTSILNEHETTPSQQFTSFDQQKETNNLPNIITSNDNLETSVTQNSKDIKTTSEFNENSKLLRDKETSKNDAFTNSPHDVNSMPATDITSTTIISLSDTVTENFDSNTHKTTTLESPVKTDASESLPNSSHKTTPIISNSKEHNSLNIEEQQRKNLLLIDLFHNDTTTDEPSTTENNKVKNLKNKHLSENFDLETDRKNFTKPNDGHDIKLNENANAIHDTANLNEPPENKGLLIDLNEAVNIPFIKHPEPDITDLTFQPAKLIKVHLTPVTFDCKRISQSIPYKFRCNHKADCEDGTDEHECTCAAYIATFNEKLLCDGIMDCADGMDENNCYTCEGDHFLCKSSQTCIPKSHVCDSVAQCPRGEDEQDCFALTNGKNVLIDVDGRPRANLDGFMTRKHGDDWDIICEDNLMIEQQENAANRICRYLGFSGTNRFMVKYVNIKEHRHMKTLEVPNPRQKRQTTAVPIHFKYTSNDNEDARHIVIKEPEILKEHCVPNITKTCMSLYVYCEPTLFTDFSLFDVNQDLDFESRSNNEPFENTSKNIDEVWPWTAKIYIEGEYKCTGILIDLSWVLIEQSCLGNTLLTHHYVTAVLGSRRTLNASTGPQEQIYTVDYKTDLYDIKATLLHLSQPAHYTPAVKPMVVPNYTLHTKQDVCVTTGQDMSNNTISIFLEETHDCQVNMSCFVRRSKEPICSTESMSNRPWSGLISCQVEGRWFPTASFVEHSGECRAGDKFIATDMGRLRNEITPYIGKFIQKTADPQDVACEGTRCARGRCLPLAKSCDGVRDCEDGLDETPLTCERKNQTCAADPHQRGCVCTSGQLRCKNGACVSKEMFGDDHDDCGDGSDEPKRNICAQYLALVAPSKLCDGHRHCADRSDEEPAFCKCFAKNSYRCSSSEFCVAPDLLCDGVRDCPNGDDEKTCLALQTSEDNPIGTGEVMIQSYGVWHTKCYSKPNHTRSELEKICRQLGFNADHAKQLKPPSNQSVYTKVVLDDFNDVMLNNNTGVKLRTSDQPLAKAVAYENPDCYPVFIECL